VNWFKSSRKKESEDYEKEFLSRYKKQQKAKPEKKASKQLEWEPEPKPKQNIKKERKQYENEYVSRFEKLEKTKLKIAALEQKLRLSQIELEEPKRDIKKERKDYEKEFLSRYKKKSKTDQKKRASKPLEPKLENR